MGNTFNVRITEVGAIQAYYRQFLKPVFFKKTEKPKDSHWCQWTLAQENCRAPEGQTHSAETQVCTTEGFSSWCPALGTASQDICSSNSGMYFLARHYSHSQTTVTKQHWAAWQMCGFPAATTRLLPLSDLTFCSCMVWLKSAIWKSKYHLEKDVHFNSQRIN